MGTLELALNIGAVLLSPIIALQVSEKVRRKKDRRDRQLDIFRTLMATRTNMISSEHVKALNMIDVEFHGTDKLERRIGTAWKEYVDFLSEIRITAASTEAENKAWIDRRNELYATLMLTMGAHLGFEFDRVQLKKQAYWPQAHSDIEQQQFALRVSLLSVLKGEQAITVRPSQPSTPSHVEPALKPRSTHST